MARRQVQQTAEPILVDDDTDDDMPSSPQAAAQTTAIGAKAAALKAQAASLGKVGRAGYSHSHSNHDHQGQVQHQGGGVIDQCCKPAEAQRTGLAAAAHKMATAPHTGRPKKARRPPGSSSSSARDSTECVNDTQVAATLESSGSTFSSDETPLAKLASTTSRQNNAQSAPAQSAATLRRDANHDLLDVQGPDTVQIEPVMVPSAPDVEPSEQGKGKPAQHPAHMEDGTDMHRAREQLAVRNSTEYSSNGKTATGAKVPDYMSARTEEAGDGQPLASCAERENTDEKAAAAAAAGSSYANTMIRGLLAGKREERATDPASQSQLVTAKPRSLSSDAGSAAAHQEPYRRPKQAGAEDHAVAATATVLPVSPACELNLNAWVRSAWVKTQGPPFRTNLSSRAVSELRALPENYLSRTGKLGRRALSLILLITCRRCSNHTHVHSLISSLLAAIDDELTSPSAGEHGRSDVKDAQKGEEGSAVAHAGAAAPQNRTAVGAVTPPPAGMPGVPIEEEQPSSDLRSDDDSDSDDSLPAILPPKQPKPHLVSTVDKPAHKPLAKPLGEPLEKPAGKKDKPAKKDSTPGAMDVAKNKTAAGMTADVRPAALTKPPGAPLKAAARNAAEHNGANHKAVAVKGTASTIADPKVAPSATAGPKTAKRQPDGTAKTIADPKVAPSATDKRQPDADAEPTAKKARPTSATSSHQASNSGKRKEPLRTKLLPGDEVVLPPSRRRVTNPSGPIRPAAPSAPDSEIPASAAQTWAANGSNMNANDEDDDTLVNMITDDLQSPGLRKDASSNSCNMLLKRRPDEGDSLAKHLSVSGSIPASKLMSPRGEGEVKRLSSGLGPKRKEPLRPKAQPEAVLSRRRVVFTTPAVPSAPVSGLPASAAQVRPWQAPSEPNLQPFLRDCQTHLYETLFCESNTLELMAAPWASTPDYSTFWASAALREMAVAAKQSFDRMRKCLGQLRSQRSLPPPDRTREPLSALLHFTTRTLPTFDRLDLVAVSAIDRRTGNERYLFGVIDSVEDNHVSVMCPISTFAVVQEPFHKLLLEVKDMHNGFECKLQKLESMIAHLRRYSAANTVGCLGWAAEHGSNQLARQIIQINCGMVPPVRAHAKVEQHLKRLRVSASQGAAIRLVG
jgi:hypothetical protein